MNRNRAKKYVVIASAGRTGTNFLGDQLCKIIDDAYSVHEPDIFAGFNRKTLSVLKHFSLYHITIGKMLGRTGIRSICEDRMAGRISPEVTAEKIRAQRTSYFANISESLIVESYTQWFGLLPDFQRVWPESRFVGIVRDPRSWIRSVSNHQGEQAIYGDLDRVGILGRHRLRPSDLGQQAVAENWPRFTSFERRAWYWSTVTRQLRTYSQTMKDYRLYRFEDLFLNEDRQRHMLDLLSFITKFEDDSFSYTPDPEILETQVNSARGDRMPRWQDWEDWQVKALDQLCGSEMQQFGYGQEAEWKSRVQQSGTPQ